MILVNDMIIVLLYFLEPKSILVVTAFILISQSYVATSHDQAYDTIVMNYSYR